MKQGSVLGGALLVAGSCIGAGMLALPIVTGMAGFFYSTILFFLAWSFMTSTALLLVETNSWFHERMNFLSLLDRIIGKSFKAIGWVTYLFLFYALLVAYISGTGTLFASFFYSFFNLQIPDWTGSVALIVLFGWVVYLGTRSVDLCNRFLMSIKIIFFGLLVLFSINYVNPQLLLHVDFMYAPKSFPLLIIAFGFQNMVPSLTNYMKGDLKRVRLSIVMGSLIAFAVYLIWEFIVLGILPLDQIMESLQTGRDSSQGLSLFLNLTQVKIWAGGLAFFAILTSFFSQALSLVHFLSDGFKVRCKKHESLSLCLLAFSPPLLFALCYPQFFFRALSFAGGICAVILYGILPVIMVWVGRYHKAMKGAYQFPFGKLSLVLVFIVAVSVLLLQIVNMLGSNSV
ncbi:Tyrosine-specific transport protein [Candidatus Rhabdochlamydia oedothoracis]|uniref:Tyrosine-specific transport protein n=1 Tax=Candidatus Rhabdochlamydia oedothoracis TaxID=2720720 RepID=A0ABX8UYV9_9BACT|nr:MULTISPECIES: aromatic amino acid transport family protein [Rhabdochlamydia]KAG6558891.1 Tyrosine-specific transport protein [Candidatus Rhabdochlamydia sp. W815]MCL6756673.1 tyrosine transporter [Candidatus Rhabdochlamydia oedothoracis]QYF48148.1 Tyrosine-specific transport protein [Candidatus Rhabdochlamydia oedothoracis]